MSIFSSIVNAILHHSSGKAQGSAPTPSTAQAATTAPSTAGTASASGNRPAASASSTASAGTQTLQTVDVDAVLTQLATKKGGGGNWRTSIVDLLKLLDLDSSLAARKDLANELNVRAGADGSAEQNIALHKAVMNQLAANGGKVPDSLRH